MMMMVSKERAIEKMMSGKAVSAMSKKDMMHAEHLSIAEVRDNEDLVFAIEVPAVEEECFAKEVKKMVGHGRDINLDKKKVEELMDAGLTLAGAAKELGVSRACLSDYAGKYGIDIGSKKFDESKATALWEAGWSVLKIADEIGANKKEVQKFIRGLENGDKGKAE